MTTKTQSKAPTLVIYRRKLVYKDGGHKRGGTWKVAYADFITAMMAFFLMLWLLSITSQDKLQSIAEYFAVTKPNSDKTGTGLDGNADSNISENISASTKGSSLDPQSRNRSITKAQNNGMVRDVEQKRFLDIMNTIKKSVEIKDYMDNINIDITSEGLRIQIMDSENRPVFKPDTYELQPYMNKVLRVVAKMIKDQPNYLAISGHTAAIKDQILTTQQAALDYWALSTMRANEVRKFLTQNLIQDDHIMRLVGWADREPFDYKDPYNPKNIRVSITLLNNDSISNRQQSVPSAK